MGVRIPHPPHPPHNKNNLIVKYKYRIVKKEKGDRIFYYAQYSKRTRWGYYSRYKDLSDWDWRCRSVYCIESNLSLSISTHHLPKAESRIKEHKKQIELEIKQLNEEKNQKISIIKLDN